MHYTIYHTIGCVHTVSWRPGGLAIHRHIQYVTIPAHQLFGHFRNNEVFLLNVYFLQKLLQVLAHKQDNSARTPTVVR